MEHIYRPVIFSLGDPKDKDRLHALLTKKLNITVFDSIESQIKDLIKVLHPAQNPDDRELADYMVQHLNGKSVADYGVWVYYPWSNRLVHTLDEEEFVRVRTNRNREKITQEEQDVLAAKVVGIVGLSVGQSIALTMAMERACGTLRLADYDHVDLSNLNRIRTGIHNLDIPKTVIAAREIAEIDPFLRVELFHTGLTTDNMDDFFAGSGKLDVLVEVCDGLEVKLKSRVEARRQRIPVVMETNDRGMVDIERFDTEPNRPILHGLIAEESIDNVAALTGQERLSLISQLVDAEQLSPRMKQSFAEVGKSLRSWPQLASSVVLGGGITTEIVRRILLGEKLDSGRRYFDVDMILPQVIKF
ncbi:Rv1355c family protein [Sphingobacterium griseoflavum]|uniref:THIF-type NAD/FAD binding fold domain-containing protein n=1 Tax=Sphingobacterium griseoflavum TaxID=1474952 RepID=A0ABQ3HTH7_9SPHI|nr:Rv1355c family protein [Sphingobacterium griseoflavum]GHE33244.1 hypothetical protein GCM10017764_15410 [Sphingobacterium griseoflavum]